jgi:formylglycine-generating enzyme required for sulfatase activity
MGFTGIRLRVPVVTAILVVWIFGLISGCSSTSSPSKSDGEDSPEFILVEAGTFTMGDGAAYCGVEQHDVTLTRDFYIKQHEVTNREYIDAVQWAYNHGYVTATTTSVLDNLDGSVQVLVDLEDGGCEIAFEDGRFSLRLEVPKGDHPMKEVTWYGAARYCDWLSLQEDPPLPRAYEHSGDWACNGGDPYGAEGYRLPTDAEWEFAAQYDDERIYPWGDEEPTCTLANFQDCLSSGTYPVGSFPLGRSALGMDDMAGNSLEWCNDMWVCNLGTEPATDPVGPGSGVYRVMRGGSYYSLANGMRCASRPMLGSPGTSEYQIGFRVARTASP